MFLFRGHGLKWIGICLLFIVPLITIYAVEKQVKPLQDAFSSTFTEFQYAETEGEWLDFDSNLYGEKVTGTYWFKTSLPENRWRDPYMYLIFVHNAEVYLDNERIYTFAPRYEYWEHPHLIKLPDDFAGQTLIIKSTFDNQPFYPGKFLIDSPLNLVFSQVMQSSYRLILGLVTFLLSIAGFVLYARRREASNLYFSLFALYIAQLCIARSWYFIGLFATTPNLLYFQDVILAIGSFCFLRFYESVFGKGPYRIHRRLSQVMLVVFVPLLVTALWFPAFYLNYMSFMIQNIIAPIALTIILISSIYTYWKRRDRESFWFMAGFVTFGMATLLYFLQPFLQLSAIRMLFYGDRFLHSIFILLFCMAMIMTERIRSIYIEAQKTAEELAELSGSLERLVQERTKELEQTNQNLRSSMRETAEALAEVAVLEDRNRIAQDMHDRTGHALTAALIQIEAVKMLAEKDPALALKKIDATRESVASGLESIRETVRMMKLDYEERSLVPSILKLIQETERATGIDIIYDPSPLPDLNSILKKSLYLALQEGLTNGIRHGKATRFDFTLKAEGSTIHFQLANNGKPYANEPFGFGLKTMRERMERLNGTLHIESNDDYACILNIVLPFEQDDDVKQEE